MELFLFSKEAVATNSGNLPLLCRKQVSVYSFVVRDWKILNSNFYLTLLARFGLQNVLCYFFSGRPNERIYFKFIGDDIVNMLYKNLLFTDSIWYIKPEYFWLFYVIYFSSILNFHQEGFRIILFCLNSWCSHYLCMKAFLCKINHN